MALTVLDSSDTTAILADAGIILEAETEPKEAPKEEPKAAGQNANAKVEPAEDPDDIEGEDGLTPRQKRELTDKMQKAIGKKHRMLREAEEFAAAQYSEKKLAEQRAAELERQLAESQKGAQPAKAQESAPEKPQRQNFATETEYLDAMIEFGVEQRLAKEREARAREEAQRRQDELIATAKSRIAKAAELVPDYMDVVGAVDAEVPPAVAGYMQKSEMFAELGYHLAKNPEILVSLAKLAPDEQLVKIGKIESTLKPFGSKDDPTPQASNTNGQAKPAPSDDTGTPPSKARNTAPVITPLNGNGASADKDFKDMNIREAISDYAKRNQINLNIRKRH